LYIATAIETVVAYYIMMLSVLIYSYAMTRLALPLADKNLASMDVILGLHVSEIIIMISQNTLLDNILLIAYM
jgi:hypothetical protein